MVIYLDIMGYQWHIWLVVWNMAFMFPYIGNNTPNRRNHIFQRGRYTINQKHVQYIKAWIWFSQYWRLVDDLQQNHGLVSMGKNDNLLDDSFLGEALVWSVDLRWFKHRDMVNIRLIVFETIRLIAQKNSFGTPDSFYWDGLRTCHPSLLGMVLHIFSSFAPDKIHVESSALKLTWRTRFSSLPMTSENEWRQNFKQHLSWWCSSERSIAKLEFPHVDCVDSNVAALFVKELLILNSNPHQSTTGWWFGTFFIFPYVGNNHPNWLSYFSEG